MKTPRKSLTAYAHASTSLVVAAIGSALFLGIWAMTPTLATWLTEENGLVETATMAFFAGTSLSCGYFAIRTKTSIRYYFLLWAVLCFVFFGEEISWGQHWLGFATPELLSSNVQGEANIHNLPWFTPKVVENPNDFLSSQGVFYAGFFAYFLLLPLASRWRGVASLLKRLRFPAPQSRLLAAIWIPITLSFFLALVTKAGPTRDALTELREFYFAFSILLYAMFLISLANRPQEKQALAVSAAPLPTVIAVHRGKR